MKKSFFLLPAAVAVAFASVTLLKIWHSSSDDETRSVLEEEKRKRIASFWQAYHEATRLRIQEDFSGAVKSYEKALQLNPDHEESLYYLGNCLFELGQYSEAVKAYQKMTQLNINSHRGFSQLGVTLSTPAPGGLWQPEQAKQAFLRNAQINQEESGPFLRLGLLALNQDDLNQAFGYFQTAAGFGSPEGYFLSGLVRFHEARFREAMGFFQKVLEINAREKKITGRGVLSEGDIKADASQQVLTPLEAAGVKSLIYLFWAAAQMGGYPESVEETFRIRPPDEEAKSGGFKSIDLTAARGLETLPRGRATWADYDADGDLDLAVASPAGGFALYRNRQGRFIDVTDQTGLAGVEKVWDSCWADYDGDGDPDLYLVRPGFLGEGRNTLLRNDGGTPQAADRHFTDVTAAAGLALQRSTARAIFLDYNGDGKPDLIEVGNAGFGYPSLRLFRNEGKGQFSDSSKKAEISLEGSAVDCAAADYDQDGWTDLLILRWKRPVLLLRNNGNGTFADMTAASNLARVVGDGFSALFFDYNGDQRPDLLITTHAPYEKALLSLLKTDYTATRHTPRLFRNTSSGGFEEVTAQVHLNRCYGVMQAVAADVDRDGWSDLVFANGGPDNYRLEPSLVLRNREGQRFDPLVYLPRTDRPSNALGAAVADFDSDGNVEVLLPGSGLYSIQR